MRVAVNWSGGKDCCMAAYYATKKGYEISTLLNFTFTNYGRETPLWLLDYLAKDIGKSTPAKFFAVSSLAFKAAGRRVSSKVKNSLKASSSRASGATKPVPTRRLIPHEISPSIVALQAQAMRVPIIQKETTWGEFDNQFKQTLRKLDPKDVEGGVVSGMIPPDPVLDHPRKAKKATGLMMGRGWWAKQLRDLGLKAIFPLVDKTPEELLADLVDKKFQALIVVVNPAFIGEEWLGRTIDQDFIKLARKLNQEKGVPMLGDEYHSFVLDCPLFKERIQLVESKRIAKDGYSVLEISKAKLVAKT
jgi:diphthine-ammonia ligase